MLSHNQYHYSFAPWIPVRNWGNINYSLGHVHKGADWFRINGIREKRRSIGTLLTPKHGLVSYVIIRTVSEWPQIHYLVKSMARVFSISHRGIKPSNIPIILTENLQSAQQQRANSSS